jgi:hypothetical protein
MKTNPEQQTRDIGLAGVEPALQRAQQQARETAARTGTPLVIYRDGKIEELVVTESEDNTETPGNRT